MIIAGVKKISLEYKSKIFVRKKYIISAPDFKRLKKIIYYKTVDCEHGKYLKWFNKTENKE